MEYCSLGVRKQSWHPGAGDEGVGENRSDRRRVRTPHAASGSPKPSSLSRAELASLAFSCPLSRRGLRRAGEAPGWGQCPTSLILLPVGAESASSSSSFSQVPSLFCLLPQQTYDPEPIFSDVESQPRKAASTTKPGIANKALGFITGKEGALTTREFMH